MNLTVKINNQEFSGKIINSSLKNEFRTSLPIKGSLRRYGDEMYFTVDYDWEYENGDGDTFEIGDLIFWKSQKSTKKAIALFFGSTPLGDGTLPRAPSDAVKIGSIDVSNAELENLATDDIGLIEFN